MAKKASEHFKLYKNPDGPDITTVARPRVYFVKEGFTPFAKYT